MTLLLDEPITRTALVKMADYSVVKCWAGPESGPVDIPGIGQKTGLKLGMHFNDNEYRVMQCQIVRDEEPGFRRLQELKQVKNVYIKKPEHIRQTNIHGWKSIPDMKRVIARRIKEDDKESLAALAAITERSDILMFYSKIFS